MEPVPELYKTHWNNVRVEIKLARTFAEFALVDLENDERDASSRSARHARVAIEAARKGLDRIPDADADLLAAIRAEIDQIEATLPAPDTQTV